MVSVLEERAIEWHFLKKKNYRQQYRGGGGGGGGSGPPGHNLPLGSAT